jgi:hypothetical protein
MVQGTAQDRQEAEAEEERGTAADQSRDTTVEAGLWISGKKPAGS